MSTQNPNVVLACSPLRGPCYGNSVQLFCSHLVSLTKSQTIRVPTLACMAQLVLDVPGYMWGASPKLAHIGPHPTLGHIYRDVSIPRPP